MKTTNIELRWNPQVKKWVCEWHYNVTTSWQFTDVATSVHVPHRYLWMAILKAWMAARKKSAMERAKPGEREVNGWLG